MNDKNMIWRDCASCARKHLYAAYALLSGLRDDYTGETPLKGYVWEVLAARGNILRSEEDAGYKGNGGLADGCFGAAEVLAYRQPPQVPENLRAARLHRGRYGYTLPETAMAAAHIIEAIRELPDLWHKMVPTYDGDTVSVTLYGADSALDAIESAARWVEDTFELTGAETAAAVGSVEGVCASANDCDTCRHRVLSPAKDPCLACQQTTAVGAQFSKWEPQEEKK